jgi:hypothetical protein
MRLRILTGEGRQETYAEPTRGDSETQVPGLREKLQQIGQPPEAPEYRPWALKDIWLASMI